MAELRVWVQSTSVTEPTKVTVAGDSDVDDLKEAAIKKFKIPYAAPYCSIKLSEDGETVIVSAKVKDLPCGHDVNSPLLLVLPREEGMPPCTMHYIIVVFKSGNPYSNMHKLQVSHQMYKLAVGLAYLYKSLENKVLILYIK